MVVFPRKKEHQHSGHPSCNQHPTACISTLLDKSFLSLYICILTNVNYGTLILYLVISFSLTPKQHRTADRKAQIRPRWFPTAAKKSFPPLPKSKHELSTGKLQTRGESSAGSAWENFAGVYSPAHEWGNGLCCKSLESASACSRTTFPTMPTTTQLQKTRRNLPMDAEGRITLAWVSSIPSHPWEAASRKPWVTHPSQSNPAQPHNHQIPLKPSRLFPQITSSNWSHSAKVLSLFKSFVLNHSSCKRKG